MRIVLPRNRIIFCYRFQKIKKQLLFKAAAYVGGLRRISPPWTAVSHHLIYCLAASIRRCHALSPWLEEAALRTRRSSAWADPQVSPMIAILIFRPIPGKPEDGCWDPISGKIYAREYPGPAEHSKT
jgi:hypothetical protein